MFSSETNVVLLVFGAPVERSGFFAVVEKIGNVAEGVFVEAGEVVGECLELPGAPEAIVGIAGSMREGGDRRIPLAALFCLEGAFVEDDSFGKEIVFADFAAFAFVCDAVGFEDRVQEGDLHHLVSGREIIVICFRLSVFWVHGWMFTRCR